MSAARVLFHLWHGCVLQLAIDTLAKHSCSVCYVGKMVYHGPRVDILPFFASLGMDCPARKADSDFLQEVTSRKDQEVFLLF